MTKTKLIFTAVFAFFVSCASDDTTREHQGADNIPTGATLFNGETYSGATRTAIVEHTKGGGAKVNWSAGDQIWVKDNGGTWRQSDAAAFPISANKSFGVFALNGTYSNLTHQVVYTNLPITATAQVEIKSAQTQSATNNFDHAGESGDCGVATAKKRTSGGYEFVLDHKAAYLCFYPRIKNDRLHKNVKLNKIVITSTSGPIAGKYDFSTGSLGATPTSSASNTITLATASGEISSDTRMNTCYYAVISPGNHTLKAEYYIEDPTTHVSDVVSKDLGTISCTAGKIADITAWVDKDIPDLKNNYYQWDAQQKYWAGFEWNSTNPQQPTANGVNNDNCPKSNTDLRWYNEISGFGGTDPITYENINPLFKSIPNAHEMVWYVMKGDPHWDANQIWTAFGHLYKSGMWFKKLSKIAADEGVTMAHMKVDHSEASPNGLSMNIVNSSISTTPLSHAEQADYFFLPAMGYYKNGTLNDFGNAGRYWTSTFWGMPGYAHYLEFDSSMAMESYYQFRVNGLMTVPFK